MHQAAPTSSMVKGHMVNLHAIVSRLINKRTYGVIDNMQKNFGLALRLWENLCFALEGTVLWMLEP